MAYVELPLGGGLNLKSRATDIGADQLQQATGCRYDVRGAVSSDTGRASQFGLGAEIRGMADATLGGVKRILAKAGMSIFSDNTSVATLGTGEGHASFAVWNDYAYVADGTTTKRLSVSGTTWEAEPMGLSAPDSAPTVTASGTGLTTAGVYKYVYTFYNGVAESNFSPEGEDTATALQEIDLTDVDVGPEGTTERRIYRTKVNGVAYFYVGTIEDNTTTTFNDPGALPAEASATAAADDDVSLETRPEATIPIDSALFPATTILDEKFGPARANEARLSNLGILADWTDHDPPPTGLKHLVIINAQILGIADNRVYFSKSGQPEHWPIYNQLPAGRQTGDTIKSILPLGDSLIVYTDARVYRIDLVGLDFEDSRTIETDSPVGLAGEWAVAEVVLSSGQPAHVFLASNGLYLFDGQSAVEVSRDIEELFTNPSHADAFNLNRLGDAVMTSHRDRLWLSYAAGGSQTNNRTLRVDFQDQQTPRASILPYGYTTLARDRVLNAPIGGDGGGTTYKIENGSGGLWEPTTRDYDFGESTRLKKFEEVVIDADLGGHSTTMTVTTDLGREAVYILNGTGRQRYSRHLPKTFKGRFASIGLSSTGSSQRHWYNAGMNVLAGDVP
jgi:hypothetical protein